MRPSKHEVMMRIAHIASERSTCRRRRVGCVLTDEAREIIAMGYNGGPRGGLNDCARETPGRCGCLHAEINALLKAPRGLTIAYVTTFPCEACATALINFGVVEVWHSEDYREDGGAERLGAAGIRLERLTL